MGSTPDTHWVASFFFVYPVMKNAITSQATMFSQFNVKSLLRTLTKHAILLAISIPAWAISVGMVCVTDTFLTLHELQTVTSQKDIQLQYLSTSTVLYSIAIMTILRVSTALFLWSPKRYYRYWWASILVLSENVLLFVFLAHMRTSFEVRYYYLTWDQKLYALSQVVWIGVALPTFICRLLFL